MTRALWTHLAKDLRIEWRTLDAIISMLFFSGLVVVLFSIAFDPRGEFSQQIAGGVLCVATMFASVSALNQAWAREIRHQVMDAQRMVPRPAQSFSSPRPSRTFSSSPSSRSSWRPSLSSSTTCTSRARGGCCCWCCPWAHGLWSATASSLPRSP